MNMAHEVPTHTVAERATSLRLRAVELRVTAGPDVGRTARLDRPSFVVGGGESADLRLTDRAISREHLRITLDAEGVRVRDEGSKNGTFIGGARVRDMVMTEDFALTLGGTVLLFTMQSEVVLPLSAGDRFGDAIGTSPAMRHLFANLERFAATDFTVLLEGESGVGKDLIAQSIHARSARTEGPFVVLDCSAIPENLIESELFGHERGAFTGADRARTGAFELAHGGTLFLDEIGELPLELQPKLLRALEQREIRPIGGNDVRHVDVRVIAATNRKLGEAARVGTFRSDLFYRLAVLRVSVPPLRERAEDILPIARAMLRATTGDPLADFGGAFASMLCAYAWPGNVRELRNVVERYAAVGAEGIFGGIENALPSDDDRLAELSYQEAKKIVMDRFEDAYVPRVLARADGVISRAAELAGVARPSFYRMLERSNFVRGGALDDR
ncbi:MAG: sigma 54-interacting transcriptional regulator [Labilithrix sp.]|nr:sigma 54-interacting transcriptional regulator [Labilithrix sp.]